jgi:hypothetical protein
MYAWDVAERAAKRFDAPWQEQEAERREERARLRAAIAEAPAAAARLAIEAGRRILKRERRESRPRAWLREALRARQAGDAAALAALASQASQRLAEVDAYLEIAPGWAQGCEMETSELERAVLRAVVALTAPDAIAAAQGVADACVEHAAYAALLAAYAKAATPTTQVVARQLAHREEAAHLALRLLALASE